MNPEGDVTNELGRGRYLRLVRSNGWEWVERTNVTGVVVIAALTPADEILLVEQFRPPVGQSVVELPAGLAGDIDADEALSTAAAPGTRRGDGLGSWASGQRCRRPRVCRDVERDPDVLRSL